MIVIDAARCVGCGTCVKVCHNRCVALVAGIADIDDTLCDRCTQCASVCPRQALSWDRAPLVVYEPGRLPSSEHLDELFKERRSIRFFKKKRLDRLLLDKIVGYGIYAPTNNHDMRAVVVDDAEVIRELERITERFNSRMYKLFFRPAIVFEALRRISPSVTPQVRAKLEARRHDVFNPAAMVLIVGDRRIAFSEASAQAALDQMTFYGQVRGVGSCLWGAGVIVLDRNRAARAQLGLRRGEHILGILLLGYPAVRFVNKVEGRTMDTTWIGKGDGMASS